MNFWQIRGAHGRADRRADPQVRASGSEELGEPPVMTSVPAPPRRTMIVLVFACLVFGAGWALLAGEDVSWDWRNYHEHNVWAWLHARRDIDAMPAGFHTYFNMVAYLPAYALRHGLPVPAGAMILGALQMLNLVIVWRMTQALLRPASLPLLSAAVLISAAGAMLLSEIGTSFIDIVTAAPVIGGIYCLMRAPDAAPVRFTLVAGVLIGAAVGLKLTNAVFAVAAIGAVLAARRPLVSLIALGGGGAIGALVVDGVSAYRLWREFGNPIFPLLNGIFHSPETADTIVVDTQFFPKGLGDALLYPWYWLEGGTRTSEVPMRDAGFAVVAVLLLLCVVTRLLRRRPLFDRADLQLVIFVVLAYVVWLKAFAIQRYIVALELLRGPLIVMMLVRLLAPVGGETVTPALRRTGLVALAIAALLVAWVRPGDWNHRSWAEARRPFVVPPQLARPADYLVLDKPLGYLSPRLPEGSRFALIADIAVPVVPGGVFDRRIRDSLQRPLPGGVFMLHIVGSADRTHLLQPYGLRVDPNRTCVTLDAIWDPVEACPLTARD